MSLIDLTNKEFEGKYLCSRDSLDRIKQYHELGQFKLINVSQRHLLDNMFDTEYIQIVPAGGLFRLRNENGKHFLTFKEELPQGVVKGVHHCNQYEELLSNYQVELFWKSSLDSKPLRKLGEFMDARSIHGMLWKLMDITGRRTAMLYRCEDTLVEVALDEQTFVMGDKHYQACFIESELKGTRGDYQLFMMFSQYLERSFNLAVCLENKVKHALGKIR